RSGHRRRFRHAQAGDPRDLFREVASPQCPANHRVRLVARGFGHGQDVSAIASSHGKTVIVTGGSRGLGLGIVTDCLEHGWRVATFSRSSSKALDELTEAAGDRLYAFTTDQSDPTSSQLIVEKVVERFGSFTALVNNAAIAADGVLATMQPETTDRLTDVNVRAVVQRTRSCTRHFCTPP